MQSELVFLLLTFTSLGAVFVASVMGREWIHALIIVLVLAATFTAGKLTTVFGYTASVATPIYAGIFLATDALSEFYGKNDALRAVWKGFAANMLFVVLGQLVLMSPILSGDAIGLSLAAVLGFVPRLVAGGALAYMVSQWLDVVLYEWIKRRTNGKHLWLRNNGSTIVSQLVDSAIVYVVAFAGLVPNLLEIIVVAWCMKIVVALLDTPFIYLIRKYHVPDSTRQQSLPQP